MSYVGNNQNRANAYAREREMLLAGRSYREIAEQTGERQKTISERNRLIHKVNIWEAFAERCAREGVPCRNPTDAAFCAWFTGFFDGEGCIVAFTRPSSGRAQYSEFRLQVRIQVRYDDAQAIHAIISGLGCGFISQHIRSYGTTRPSISWNCEKIQDLREVIIPIFDKFPLRTKKAQEYAFWRPLVVQRYIDTLGGYSNRIGVKKEYVTSFQSAIEAIRKIRHP